MTNKRSAGFNDYDWDPERLRKLIDISGCSDRSVAKAAGVSAEAMSQYLIGKTKPAIRALMAFADLFAVPVDYLLGRCTEEQNAIILYDYKSIYQDLRRTEYENLLLRKSRNSLIPDGFEAPYPYNLMDDIFTKPTDWILTEDNINGLRDAVASLTEREQQVLRYRYEDGLTLTETGEKINVGQERIRQIQAKALRKLRHPSRSKQILYGAQGYFMLRKLREKAYDLECRECELNEKEEKLKAWEELLDARTAADEKLRNALDDKTAEIVAAKKLEIALDDCSPIEELDLSVRAFNCLKRANINMLGEIVEAYRSGKILKIRNMGRKTADELAKLIKDRTGVDVLDFAQSA